MPAAKELRRRWRIGDDIDIGVFGETKKNGKAEQTVLYMQKLKITAHDVDVEVVVDSKPVRAGIDPYNKLVDRNSDDNVIDVEDHSVKK